MARVVFVYGFALSFFLFHAFADAGLIRGSGRGSRTASAAEEFYLVNNIHANRLGLAFDYQAISSTSLQVGRFAAGAAERGCYREFEFGDPEYDNFVDDPCYYQFNLGERLQFTGFTSIFLSNADRIEAIWSIRQGLNRWQFVSDASNSETTLDVLMPADLIPGEYSVSLTYYFYSGNDTSFFYNPDNHNNFPNNCGELIPGDPNSYTCAYDYEQRDSLSFGATERMVILAAVIDSPSSLVLLLFSGLLLIRRMKN